MPDQRTGMDQLTIAAIQLCSGQNRDENLRRAESLMEDAVRRGASILALPENIPYIGSDKEKMSAAEKADDGPTVQFLRTFAAEHSVAIVGGSIPLKTDDPDRVTNSCLVFDQHGSQEARYDKIHLFDAEVGDGNAYDESRFVRAGTTPTTVTLLGHVLGLSICYDLRFPELYRGLAARGAEILFVPSAFTRETGRDHWEILLRARAIENLCYVVAPAQSGDHGGGRTSYGRTMIVGPWGQVLAQCQDGEGMIVTTIDFGILEQTRRKLPGIARTILAPH